MTAGINIDNHREIAAEPLLERFYLGRNLRRIGQSGLGGFAAIGKQNAVEEFSVTFYERGRRLLVINARHKGKIGVLLTLGRNDCPRSFRREILEIVGKVVDAPCHERGLARRESG